MTHKRTRTVFLAMIVLSVVAAACSAQPAAPATVAPTSALPASVAPAPSQQPTDTPPPTQGPATAPAISESPLRPGAGDSPLQPGLNDSPLQPAGAGSFAPLSSDACEALRTSVADTLKADAQLETAGFRDYVGGGTGQGCLITVRGSGVQFGSSVQVAQQLEKLLTGQAWTVDPAYAADSPTGTLFGLRKDSQLALVDVGWIASADVKCPQNQPISACDMKPEQQNFIIMVNAAQGK